MTKHAGQSRWSRLLSVSAHLAIAVLWFMVLAAYLPDLLRLSVFQATEPVEIAQPTTSTAPIAVPNAAITVAAFGGLLILGLLFYIVKKFYIPATDKAVEHMTESAQKHILVTLEKRHPKLPKKEKRQISRYVVEAVYLLLIAVPLLIVFVGQPIQSETLKLLSEFAMSVFALFAMIAATLSLRD